MLRHAVDLLAAQPRSMDGMALVGHDFGAMYSAIVFGADPTLDGMVMMAPTASLERLVPALLGDRQSAEAYEAAMVRWTRSPGCRRQARPMRPTASDDQYVPQAVAAEIAAGREQRDAADHETGRHHERRRARRPRRLADGPAGVVSRAVMGGVPVNPVRNSAQRREVPGVEFVRARSWRSPPGSRPFGARASIWSAACEPTTSSHPTPATTGAARSTRTVHDGALDDHAVPAARHPAGAADRRRDRSRGVEWPHMDELMEIRTRLDAAIGRLG